jgi:hypothetical protein
VQPQVITACSIIQYPLCNMPVSRWIMRGIAVGMRVHGKVLSTKRNFLMRVRGEPHEKGPDADAGTNH